MLNRALFVWLIAMVYFMALAALEQRVITPKEVVSLPQEEVVVETIEVVDTLSVRDSL